MYSEKVMDHFLNPRNVGIIPDADGIGQVGNPICGDMMTFYIKVSDGRLIDVKFQTFGCGAAIAVSSIVSEMARGKTLDEAMTITNDLVAEELGGLPKNKLHCSNLGADALHAAITNFKEKNQAQSRQMVEKTVSSGGEEKHACPYCEGEIEDAIKLFCRACQLDFVECPVCHAYVKNDAETCASCGTAINK